MKKKKRLVRLVVFIVLLGLILWAIWGNSALELNTYQVCHKTVPAAFDGFRIAQVSDLHNTQMGKDNEKLLAMLEECKPDIIAITGDMLDSRRTDVETALAFAKKAVEIAPCYYVTGNHEARLAEYDSFREELYQVGVTVLDDEKVTLEQAGECIVVAGVNDPEFPMEIVLSDKTSVMRYKLSALANDETFTVLLSHRPEFFETYQQSGVELALCGHVHGGQIRIPFVGGLFAPDQGFFPQYDGGVYQQNGASMVVSRGIGNSSFPLRVNNPPEVVLVELHSEG